MKELFKGRIPPTTLTLIALIIVGFWIFIQPVKGAPILGIALIAVSGFLLFRILDAVRVYCKEEKRKRDSEGKGNV